VSFPGVFSPEEAGRNFGEVVAWDAVRSATSPKLAPGSVDRDRVERQVRLDPREDDEQAASTPDSHLWVPGAPGDPVSGCIRI
jgi:hypothetical protein